MEGVLEALAPPVRDQHVVSPSYSSERSTSHFHNREMHFLFWSTYPALNTRRYEVDHLRLPQPPLPWNIPSARCDRVTTTAGGTMGDRKSSNDACDPAETCSNCRNNHRSSQPPSEAAASESFHTSLLSTRAAQLPPLVSKQPDVSVQDIDLSALYVRLLPTLRLAFAPMTV